MKDRLQPTSNLAQGPASPGCCRFGRSCQLQGDPADPACTPTVRFLRLEAAAWPSLKRVLSLTEASRIPLLTFRSGSDPQTAAPDTPKLTWQSQTTWQRRWQLEMWAGHRSQGLARAHRHQDWMPWGFVPLRSPEAGW
jgi:hypothetical protein